MKNNLKKLSCLLIALVMVLSFAACKDNDGKKNDKKTSENSTKTEVQYDDSTKVDTQDDVSTEVVTQVEVSNNSAVQDFVDENGDYFIEGLKQGLEQSSGTTCDCDIYASGTEIIIDCRLNGIDNFTAEQKESMQQVYDSNNSTFASIFQPIKDEVPELTGVTLNICEEDGDILAVIDVDL